MTKIPFIVSARAGKLLGRENFSNPTGAIIELIKNSYDADAKNCIVIFDIKYETNKSNRQYSREKSQIFIIDNGEGMTHDVITNQWMKIGTGNKETQYISKNKRVKTGEKGIGRFALDRLGYVSEMWSKTNSTKKDHDSYWKMDWKQFDNSDKSISEITAELNNCNLEIEGLIESKFQSNKAIKELFDGLEFKTGTILRIGDLKDEWSSTEIDEVYKSLQSLIPPKELKIPFDVNFHHVQEPKEYGIVETAFFNDFDYKLTAKFDAQKLTVDFEITRNEMDLDLIEKKFQNLKPLQGNI